MRPRRRLLRAEDYQPLAEYLEHQPGPRVTLTLADIETLLGRPLPSSARTKTWWVARGQRTGYRRLLTPLGWTVGVVQVRRDPLTVTFVKTTPGGEVT